MNLNNTYSYTNILTSLTNLYTNGLPEGIRTNITDLDDLFRLDRGKLVTVYGVPNRGKSEFVDFLCCQFQKLYNYKTLFFSAEDTLELHCAKLIQKYTNKPFDKGTPKEEIEMYARFLSDNYIFIDYDKVYSVDSLFDEIEKQIQVQKIDILVIDPFNKLEANKEYNVMMTDYISKFLDRLLKLTKKHNILTFLVCHPRKMSDFDNIPTAYDVADSAHFFNKSDFCIAVHGNKQNYTTLIKCDKVKYKYYGSVGSVELKYHDLSGNFYCTDDFNGKYVHEYYDMNTTNKVDHLDTIVDYFDNISDTTPKQTTLRNMLFNADTEQNKLITKLRTEANENAQKELKKGLKNYCINATFEGTRSKQNVTGLTHLIYVDIDHKDNLDVIDEVPTILQSIDNILFYKRSCRGNGYTAIVPYSTGLSIDKVWYALDKDFSEQGITIDQSTKNVDRVTFYSYDPDYYYNPNAATYMKEYEPKQEVSKAVLPKPQAETKKADNRDNRLYINGLMNYCNKHEITLNRNNSERFTIALALISEFGEGGLFYLKELTKRGRGYDEAATTESYNKLMKRYANNNDVTFATIKHLAKEIGYTK